MSKSQKYYHTINISHLPQVRELAEQVRISKQPARLEVNGKEMGTLVPPEEGNNTQDLTLKPLTKRSSIWKLVGISHSKKGPRDISSNKYKYVAEAILAHHKK